MSACNEDLKAEGKTYPRTCSRCGIGKCHKLQRIEGAQLKAIAGLIQKLSYREMQDLAERLWSNLPTEPEGKKAVAEALLETCDEILKVKAEPTAPAVTRR